MRDYRLVQKKCALFEFPSLALPTILAQPMYSQSALTELPSSTLAPFLLIDPVESLSLASRDSRALTFLQWDIGEKQSDFPIPRPLFQKGKQIYESGLSSVSRHGERIKTPSC